jgi:hypothetical protein
MRVEVRSDHVLIDGYVNAVGRDSRVIPDRRGGFVEQVEPGAFARALGRGGNVEFRLNHERAIGSTATGEIELYEDNIGLRAKAKITDAEVIKKAMAKELRGWSFTFRNAVDMWEKRKDAPPRRYLKDFEMSEVTLIDEKKLPVYPATSIELRGGEESLTEYRASEDTPEYHISEVAPAGEVQGQEAVKADIKTSMAGYRARKIKLNGGTY